MAASRSSRSTAFLAAALALAAAGFFAGPPPASAPALPASPSLRAAEGEGLSASAGSAVETVVPSPESEQRTLAAHLAKRYFIVRSSAERWVASAYDAAALAGLDPLLVLAVISVESGFDPLAESAMGAKGLMQIIPRLHRDKLDPLGGDEAVLDPEANIRVGTRILQDCLDRTGTLEAGLQSYNGALWDSSAQYAQKVLAERLRLERALRAAAHADALAAREGG
ncbi:MAG: lytic transglycosylase domain-containing protein [Betaproteobacteria bacterium]|nr:lytic transglycosylase domain-containing protein [Betaproteobacteria bacterium]